MAALLESVKSTIGPLIESNPYVLPVTKLLFGLSEAYPGPIPEAHELRNNQGINSSNYDKRINWILFPIYAGPAWIPWAYKLYKMSQKEAQPPKFKIKTDKEWIALSVSFIGIAIRVFSRLWMKNQFTYFITIRSNHKLTTNGPYSIVRHPGYTGCFLWHISDAIYYGNIWAYLYVAQFVMAIMRKIPYEEKTLSDEFGEEWQKYTQKTPSKLIPFLY